MENLKDAAAVATRTQESISQLKALVQELSSKVDQITATEQGDRKWMVVIATGQEINQIEGPFPNVYPPIKITNLINFFMVQEKEPTSLDIKGHVRKVLQISDSYSLVNVMDRTHANEEEFPVINPSEVTPPEE